MPLHFFVRGVLLIGGRRNSLDFLGRSPSGFPAQGEEGCYEEGAEEGGHLPLGRGCRRILHLEYLRTGDDCCFGRSLPARQAAARCQHTPCRSRLTFVFWLAFES